VYNRMTKEVKKIVKPRLKILHTSDWHVGLSSWKTQRETDRLEEQRECLEEMFAVAKDAKVDLIIHAGDLFHHSYHPPQEAIRVVVDALLQFSSLAPFVWVVGNHDWYAVEALRDVFPKGVYVIKDLQVRVLQEVPVAIFPLPYLSLTRLLGSDLGESLQAVAQEKLHGFMEEWKKKRRPDTWNIFVAHATIEDLASRYLEANAHREVFLKRGDLPSFFHYGALGHLHGFIPLEDPFPMCYSSSLVLDNFKQADRRGGSFVLVELQEGERAKIEPHFFHTSSLMSLDLEERIGEEELWNLLTRQAVGKRNYIRLRVREEILQPEWCRNVRKLKGENWEVVMVEVLAAEEVTPQGENHVELESIPDLFARFCRENHFSEEVVTLFQNYYRRVIEEKGEL